MLRFALLGPMTVSDDAGTPLGLRAGIPCTILAMLLLNANRPVSADQIAEAVWGQRRPAAGTQALRNHVMRLRRQLGPVGGARIRTVSQGYQIDVQEGELDIPDFLHGCEQGRQALHGGDFAAARDTLAAALELWRDEPLADLSEGADLGLHRQRLQEARLLALEGRIEADLQLGRHREVIADLRALADSYPLREPLHGQLMLALYRSGRQSECRDVFQGLRRTLADELGVEPSAPLQELHRRIQAADPTLQAAASVHDDGPDPARPTAADTPAGPVRLRARYQLPSDTRAFTGRRDELDALLGLAQAAPEGSSAGMVVVSAIDGMAGIGKSALVVHAGHLMRGWFPDGQLFIDLRGHTPGVEPLPPGDALDWFLRSMGVPPQLIPRDLGERAAFYRDRLAGTRTLVVLDNAASTAQVRPLLPGARGCLVLVTSRRRLTGLDDAHSIALDVLPEGEALRLLRTVAGPGRVPEGDPAALELVDLCGRMPLAVRITGARLRHRPALGLHDVVDQLRDEQGRLDNLQDEDRNLAAVFEASYRTLPAAERRLFRLLGAVPAVDIDPYAAANLCGTDRRSAERVLESLLDHNLLTQHTPGRYGLHDLVRLYARSLHEDRPRLDQESEAALTRLMEYYQCAAAAADRYFSRSIRPGQPPQDGRGSALPLPLIGDHETARAWMRAERDNLLAAVATAEPARALALTGILAAFLHHDGPWALAIALHETAAEVARDLGDRCAEANALGDLGRVRLMSGDGASSIAAHQLALAVYRELGERHGEANSLWELGRAHHIVLDYPSTGDRLEQALSIYQELGDRGGEANARWSLGRLRLMTGYRPAAAALYELALTGYQQLGDLLGEANAQWELGNIRQLDGEYAAAAELLETALAIYQQLGNRLGEANGIARLGRLALRTEQYPLAVSLLERALAVYQSLGGVIQGETLTRHDLARVRHATGEYPAATELLRGIVAVYQEYGDPVGEANTLHDLGRVRHSAGDHAVAADLLGQSLAIFEGLRNTARAADVLNTTGALIEDSSGPAEALGCYRRALDAALESGNLPAQTRAREGVARCAAPLGEGAGEGADDAADELRAR